MAPLSGNPILKNLLKKRQPSVHKGKRTATENVTERVKPIMVVFLSPQRPSSVAVQDSPTMCGEHRHKKRKVKEHKKKIKSIDRLLDTLRKDFALQPRWVTVSWQCMM